MKELFGDIYKYVELYGKEYGFFFCLFGIIGAVVAQAQKKMKWFDFLMSLIVSAFVSWFVGVAVSELFDLSDKLIYVIVGVCGHFSKEVLEQIREVITSISQWVKAFIESKINN